MKLKQDVLVLEGFSVLMLKICLTVSKCELPFLNKSIFPKPVRGGLNFWQVPVAQT